jgi:hypothetical protein
MPRPRPTSIFPLVCLLLAPLLPPSAAQAGTTSATFSVGIRIVPRHATASEKAKAVSYAVKLDPSMRIARGTSR